MSIFCVERKRTTSRLWVELTDRSDVRHVGVSVAATYFLLPISISSILVVNSLLWSQVFLFCTRDKRCLSCSFQNDYCHHQFRNIPVNRNNSQEESEEVFINPLMDQFSQNHNNNKFVKVIKIVSYVDSDE